MSENEIRHEGEVFFVERGGKRVADLHYHLDGTTAVVFHTWVDPKLRGGGEARKLVDAAAQWARSENRRIRPACSYVRALFARSRDFDDVKAQDP